MFSELTPRVRIPDTRIPQLMQPWCRYYDLGLALWLSSWHSICWSSHEEKMTSFSKSLTLVTFKVVCKACTQLSKPNCYRYVITLLPSNSKRSANLNTSAPSSFLNAFSNLCFAGCEPLPGDRLVHSGDARTYIMWFEKVFLEALVII